MILSIVAIFYEIIFVSNTLIYKNEYIFFMCVHKACV